MTGERPGLDDLESRLAYRFHDSALLDLALTHPSWANENPGSGHYERLEFLGDSVLGYLVAEHVYLRLPAEGEGRLTPLRARFVNRTRLTELAIDLELHRWLRLGRGAGRELETAPSEKLLSSVVEAILGAILLDGGVDAVRAVLARLYGTDWSDVERFEGEELRDPTTRLVERIQQEHGVMPEFRGRDVGDPASPRFTVEVWVGDRRLAVATASSKALARSIACSRALDTGPLEDAGAEAP